jgi:hypothetical protein
VGAHQAVFDEHPKTYSTTLNRAFVNRVARSGGGERVDRLFTGGRGSAGRDLL